MYRIVPSLSLLLVISLPLWAVGYAPFVEDIKKKSRLHPKSFIVWRENIDVKKLLESSFEMVVVDDSVPKGGHYQLSQSDIEQLKGQGKTLITILNLFETDEEVLFEKEHWFEEVIQPSLHSIKERGFDGVYLKGIDRIKSLSQKAELLFYLLEKIATYLHAKDSQLYIVLEGADRLLPYDTQESLPKLLDGVATQSLFFNGIQPNYNSKERLKRLRRLQTKGLPIFVIDYFDTHRRYAGENRARFKRFKNRLRQEHFIGYGAYSDRKLDRISAISEVLLAGAKDRDKDYIPDHLDAYPNQPAIGRRENSFFQSFHLGIGERPVLPFRAEYSDNPIWVTLADIVLGMNWTQKQPLYAIDDGDGDPLVEEFDRLREEMGLGRVKFLTIWVTRGWQEQWYDLHSLQKALDHGLVLVINYAFFMDELAKPHARERVRQLVDEYERSSYRLGQMLGKLQGDILIVMEPELNKRSVLDWKAFPELIRTKGIMTIDRSVKLVKPKRTFFFQKPKKRRVFYGIAVTDTGSRDSKGEDRVFGQKSLGDSQAWQSFHPLLEPLADDLDFIAFQEMIGSFSRDPKQLHRIRKYTVKELGMADLDRRIENFAHWLHQRYHHPVLLSYIALATGTWQDKDRDHKVDADEVNPLGWVDVVAETYAKISKRYRSYASSGLFGLAPMMLFDHPSHDIGKFQYFDRNEYTFGLIATDAIAGIHSPLGGHWHYKQGKEKDKTIVETIFSD